MKKMLFTFAVLALAFTVRAAALTWSTLPYDSTGSSLMTGCSYLIQVTDKANFEISSSLGITGGSIVDSYDHATGGGMVFGAWQGTGSLVDGMEYWFAILVTTDGVVGNTVPTTGNYAIDANNGGLYSVPWATATGGDVSSVTLTDSITIKTDQVVGGTTPPTPSEPGTGGGDVPEPTALALLALGVAGLALRRRA